jgi:two-component system, chemotaxis family, protein-glutamate methylesterase/glutaminase
MTTTKIIVIGGSAGAIDALSKIIGALPATFSIPIAVVVHLPSGRPSALAEVLAAKGQLPVREAEDKEPIQPKRVFLAPPGYHLLVERAGWFSLSVDELVNYSRPSIDVLFESAADAFGPVVMGVLLSGANDDGASGLRRIRELGGDTLVQEPSTALVPTMPEAAILRGAAAHVLPLDQIGPFLAELDPAHPARCQS